MVIADRRAYCQGQEDCKKARGNPVKIENPYEAGTEAWYSWNQGWNSK